MNNSAGYFWIRATAVTFAAMTLTACASLKPVRTPAESSQASPRIERTYRSTLSCESTDPIDSRKTRQSALTGYSIGPTANIFFTDLSKQTLRPFTSDGCSSAPDGFLLAKESAVWVDCCIQHDTKYWLGGTRAEKAEADQSLEHCIAEKEYPRIAKFYAAIVSHFGRSNSSQTYRWGYGWNIRRHDEPISPSEEAQVRALYGVTGKELLTKLFTETTVLERVCDTYDPVFNGLKPEETIAYGRLNGMLKNNDQIEWSKWGYYNREFRNFEVKLRSCANPVTFKFARKSVDLISFDSSSCF